MKMNRIIAIITIVISAGILVAGFYYIKKADADSPRLPLLSPEERQWLDSHDGTITIGADPDYPPIDYVENGRHSGLSEDYFRLIEKRLNVRFKRVNPATWKDLLDGLRERRIDVIKCADSSEDRKKYALFTHPIINVPTVILTRRNVTRDYTLPELTGLRVGITRDYAVHEIVRRDYPSLTVVPQKNDEIGIRMVSYGDIDVMISDLPTASYFIEKMKITNLRIAGETGLTYHLSIGCRNDWPILHSILDKALDTITEKEKDQIFRKWIKLEYNRFLYSRSFWMLLIIMSGIVLLAVGVVSLWNRTLQTQVRERTRELDMYKNQLERIVDERTRELMETNVALNNTNEQLRIALSNVKSLSGLLPICANCKKIRNDTGYWEQIESYITNHTDVDFSHSLCPECVEKIYGARFVKKKGEDAD